MDIWTWTWKPEGVVRDTREVLRKTRCLPRVGEGRSARHKANPSFHGICKVSRVLRILAMFMMDIE